MPRPYWDPETEEAAATLKLALPLLDDAAGGHVEGAIGDSDPFATVKEAVEPGAFDEIIISTLPLWLYVFRRSPGANSGGSSAAFGSSTGGGIGRSSSCWA